MVNKNLNIRRKQELVCFAINNRTTFTHVINGKTYTYKPFIHAGSRRLHINIKKTPTIIVVGSSSIVGLLSYNHDAFAASLSVVKYLAAISLILLLNVAQAAADGLFISITLTVKTFLDVFVFLAVVFAMLPHTPVIICLNVLCRHQIRNVTRRH